MYTTPTSATGGARLGDCATANERATSIRAAMQRLSYNNDVLLETVAHVTARLLPVLGDGTPAVVSSDKQVPPAYTCELEAFIGEQTEMVCARIRSLQQIVDRLEI